MSLKEKQTWIRKFFILETKRHSKGYTVYKITSNIFPRHNPEAFTSITVWKRFNEIYKLYLLLRNVHSSLGIKDEFPCISRGTYFNRFDQEVIENRKKDILNFLSYVSENSWLFTSQCFVQFFETSQEQNENNHGNIAVIRSSLNLPREDDIYSIDSICNESENDSACSSTSHSICSSNNEGDTLKTVISNCDKLNSEGKEEEINTKINLMSSNDVNNVDFLYEESFEKDLLNFKSNDKTESDYIFQAAYHFSKAFQCERSKKFNVAIELYKIGIKCLESGIQTDSNSDRIFLINSKIDKYKKHEKLLHSLSKEDENENILISTKKIIKHKNKFGSFERPLEDLCYFHVLCITNSVLQVSDIRTKKMGIIKSVPRNDTLLDNIFPHNVPYMVPLINYFQSETTIYFLLKHISGGKLCDRINKYISNECDNKQEYSLNSININKILFDPGSVKDNSYTDRLFLDFIEKYNYKENEKKFSVKDCLVDSFQASHNSGMSIKTDVQCNINCADSNGVDNIYTSKLETKHDIDASVLDIDTEKILLNSEQLIKSISKTLSLNEQSSSQQSGIEKCTKSIKDVTNFVNDELISKTIETNYFYDDSSVLKPDKLLDSGTKNVVPISLLAKWAAELLIAIEHLHNWGIICGPILPNDLLLGEKGQLILTYRSSLGTYLQNYRIRKSASLMAPELLNPLVQPTEIYDWWYYGAALYYLFTGLPLEKMHPHGFYNYTILQVPTYVSNESTSLLSALLEGDITERLGCGETGVSEIKSHPFFSNIDWLKVLKSYTYLNNFDL